jgi:hypothetical protein
MPLNERRGNLELDDFFFNRTQNYGDGEIFEKVLNLILLSHLGFEKTLLVVKKQ